MLATNLEESKKSSDQDNIRKQRALENQQFLMEQMRSSPTPAAATSSAGDAIKPRKKQHLGGMMKPEEARMNRALLQEIARAKRGDKPTSLLNQ